MFLEPDPVVTIATAHQMQYYEDEVEAYSNDQDPMEEECSRLGLLNPLLNTIKTPFLGRVSVTFQLAPTAVFSIVRCEISRPKDDGSDTKEKFFDYSASWRNTRLLAIDGRQVMVDDGYMRQFYLTKRGTLGEFVDRLAVYQMFVPDDYWVVNGNG